MSSYTEGSSQVTFLFTSQAVGARRAMHVSCCSVQRARPEL